MIEFVLQSVSFFMIGLMTLVICGITAMIVVSILHHVGNIHMYKNRMLQLICLIIFEVIVAGGLFTAACWLIERM